VLRVKLLDKDAIAPTVGNPGEDIGYDLYACKETIVHARSCATISTGVAIEFTPKSGAVLGTRSSMAKRRLIVVGGIIDAGYRGEVSVMLENLSDLMYVVKKGDKVAQIIRCPELAGKVVVKKDLGKSKRGTAGFGSTGR
jgi:dUTP pyrophosphatase